MTEDELRTQLELELAWRQEELAFLQNQINYVCDEKRDQYRKSLILMLYAHFEGFVKIALQTYLQFLNELDIKVEYVNSNLQASHLQREFNAYDNLDRKNKHFKRKLPDDTKLHRFYRRVEFIESFDEYRDKELKLSDEIIDTESNLWYIVLQKNLYKLGLPVDLFDDYHTEIDDLVNRRNSIAHGSFKTGVTKDEYRNWENKVYRIMSNINIILYQYASEHKYLKDYEP